MNAEHKQRLLDVARACRETKHASDFNMNYFVNVCGTPACALGNYAARPDIQGRFSLDPKDKEILLDGECVNYFYDEVIDYFGLHDVEEADELFGPFGCGGTKDFSGHLDDSIITDPIKAAEYIEDFVRRYEVTP